MSFLDDTVLRTRLIALAKELELDGVAMVARWKKRRDLLASRKIVDASVMAFREEERAARQVAWDRKQRSHHVTR